MADSNFYGVIDIHIRRRQYINHTGREVTAATRTNLFVHTERNSEWRSHES